jgi:lysophospholipase L1-like esterase
MKSSRISAVLCVAAACVVFVTPAWGTKYVALGDSYSSGTGSRTYYDSTCLRSAYAYPYLLHSAHPTWTFVDAACSGATTSTVLRSQISSVSSGTDWVTYTTGGNDAGFSRVIAACAQPSWASDCDGAIDDAQAFIENRLPRLLDQLNDAIVSRAPQAKVIPLDYPRLFDGVDCNAFTWFDPHEIARLNQTAGMMRGVIRAAATRAGPSFAFGDVIPLFSGHAVCDGGSGSEREWINGLSSPLRESYHPKPTGQAQGYYRVVHRATG